MKETVTKGLRKQLIEACLAKQRLLVADFRARMRTLTEAEGLGNEESFESADVARRSANVDEINTLNSQLEFALQELSVLEQLQTTEQVERRSAALGAIVVTDLTTFFISTSIEQFQVDGTTYIGISTQSPIFKQMENKKKGDSFRFHEKCM
ncbi:MAG: hypothetical protein HC859_12520 [Bacteroidia bacterium]|nr:hypothetical protein [Bacteroidia bacterium]